MPVVVNSGVSRFTATPLIFYAFNQAHTPTTDNRPESSRLNLKNTRSSNTVVDTQKPEDGGVVIGQPMQQMP